MRTLLGQTAGDGPRRESVAAAVEELSANRTAPARRACSAGWVHPVLTAHPTEARRRAVVTALGRISGLLDALDDQRGTARRSRRYAGGCARRSTLLWRTAQLRAAHRPGRRGPHRDDGLRRDAVHALAPVLYRALDAACLASADGGRGRRRGGSRVPALRHLGRGRPGRQPARSPPQVTREARGDPGRPRAACAGERHRPDRPRPHGSRRGDTARPAGADALALEPPDGPPRTAGEVADALAAGAVPAVSALRWRSASRATRLRKADLAYGSPDFLADLRLVQDAAGRGRRRPAGVRRAAAPDLAGARRSASTSSGWRSASTAPVHAEALAELRAGGAPSGPTARGARHPAGGGLDPGAATASTPAAATCVASPGRPRTSPRCYGLARLAALGGEPPVLDVVPLFETGEDLNAAGVLDEMLGLEPVVARLRRRAGGAWRSCSATPTRPRTSARSPRRSRLYDAQAAADGVGRPARRACSRCSTAGAGRSAGAAARPTGRCSRRRPARSPAGSRSPSRARSSSPATAHPAIAHRHLEQVTSAVLLASTPGGRARGERPRPRSSGRLADRIDAAAQRAYRALVGDRGLRRVVRPVTPLEEIGGMRIGSRPARRGPAPPARGPARHPVGVRLGADAGSTCPAGTAWAAAWPPWRARAGPARGAARLPGLAAVHRAARQRGDEPGQDRPLDRRAPPRAGRPRRPDPSWCSRSTT